MGTSLSLIKVIWWLPRILLIWHLMLLLDWVYLLFVVSFLGGVIGEATQCEDLIRLKANGWVHSINALAKAARKSPQATFAAMVKS